MWEFRKVLGDSMKPTLRNGQVIIISTVRDFNEGDVVVAFVNGRDVVKRITMKQNGNVYLEGDNKIESTDSRQNGWLTDSHVYGKVVFPFWLHKSFRSRK